MERVLLFILAASVDAQIRIVGPTNCSGRVEVFYSRVWGTVCDDGWDIKDVSVVCRQVGCSPPFDGPGLAFFGVGIGPIWLDDVSCSGSESSLDSCSHSTVGIHNCVHDEDAGVVCEAFQIRLSGPSNCSGRVEVYYGGTWGTVCDGSWDINDAKAVCREVGCDPAFDAPTQALFGEGTGPVWLDNVDCSGSENSLSDCPSSGFGNQSCAHSQDAGVVCEDLKVRLSGPTSCSGRVEVYYGGVWGTVCDQGFDMNDAEVVCREVGCEAAYGVRSQAYFGQGTGSIWLSDVDCLGSENNLSDCSHSGFGNNLCAHINDVGVYCEAIFKKVVKLKVVQTSTVDLNEAAVQEDLLKQVTENLKDNGVNEDVKVEWVKQSDGKIFQEDEIKKNENLFK
ncbi:deleted in malignant brain tumors 1 protein-like isoform X1 [Kryptolebias marmoratus]|uniref:deleted in malignant brain tumors 1 protein-like isoform X1 n=1 Tax=Kryptolebias marmoratus TaxID=37003 RepID=UPI0007F868A7|nr:deleted in malignant brain tumors 1 protein-like isoform X1 [Kryptolebias marmoratus]